MVAKTGRLMQRSASPMPLTCLEEGGAAPVSSGGVSISGLLDPNFSPIKELCLAGSGDHFSFSQARNNLLQPIANPAGLPRANSRDAAIDYKALCHSRKVDHRVQRNGWNRHALFQDQFTPGIGARL